MWIAIDMNCLSKTYQCLSYCFMSLSCLPSLSVGDLGFLESVESAKFDMIVYFLDRYKNIEIRGDNDHRCTKVAQ